MGRGPYLALAAAAAAVIASPAHASVYGPPAGRIFHGGTGGHGASVITPRQIARGGGDPYLVRLGRLIAASGQVVYVRLMAEINNFNNPYCAVGATGTVRGPAHSAAAF